VSVWVWPVGSAPVVTVVQVWPLPPQVVAVSWVPFVALALGSVRQSVLLAALTRVPVDVTRHYWVASVEQASATTPAPDVVELAAVSRQKPAAFTVPSVPMVHFWAVDVELQVLTSTFAPEPVSSTHSFPPPVRAKPVVSGPVVFVARVTVFPAFLPVVASV
jgi:hypothetical protein